LIPESGTDLTIGLGPQKYMRNPQKAVQAKALRYAQELDVLADALIELPVVQYKTERLEDT